MYAQNSDGAILGTVADNSGARVPGTKIVITNIETTAITTIMTDGRGSYSAPLLPIGKYKIEAEHDGFKKSIAGPITLTVGQEAVIDFSLANGDVSETVTVRTDVPAVETTDSSVRWLVGQDQMQNLPLNGRNFVQLTLLTPGIQPVPQENTEGASALVPFGFGSPQRFSVAGGRPQGQLFLLDGTDTAGVWGNGTGVNLAGTSLGVDAIAEFEALTDTYSANYGGNGGVINAVLRSGTNNFHGSAYEFVRNSAMDARNYFDPTSGVLPFSGVHDGHCTHRRSWMAKSETTGTRSHLWGCEVSGSRHGTGRAKNISKSYGGAEVIRGVDLTLHDQELTVFVGPSGCGESTLLRLIAGLEEITSGDLLIGGQRVNDIPPAKRGLALVFQSYALYPHMNVFENMSFSLKLAGVPKAEREQKVTAAAKILNLEAYLDRKPKELSGGQRQRVAIGRAIVRNPKVFLFDEPLSNLDASLRVRMRLELTKLHRQLNATMIYVTHDQV